MSVVRAVFFDVGNTLVYPYPSVSEVCHELLSRAGHERDLGLIDSYMPLVDEYYEDRYREDDTFWTDREETSKVWIGMYSLLCRKLGIEDMAEELARAVYDEFGFPHRWRTYEDVAPALTRLRSQGLRVGIISNWDDRLVCLLDGLGVSHLLDTVISSADVGLHKPDPRIFELACERLQVEPHEAMHVGDHHYADVLGADAAGMVPVLIDRHGGQAPSSGRFLRTLDELDEYLR